MGDALSALGAATLANAVLALDATRDPMLVRGAALALCRPYALADVRWAYRMVVGRLAARGASREDMARQMADHRRPRARTAQRPRRRNTSPEACRRALYPLAS